MDRSRLCLIVLAAVLMALAVSAASARAATSTQFDVAIWSRDFQPGNPVYVNLTGPPSTNMSFNIIITSVGGGGNIVGGKDAALRPDGTYSYPWTPQVEGTYNVTVTFAVGVTISRSFLIQQRVTQADLSRIWQAIYDIAPPLAARIDGLDSKTNMAIGVGLTSFVFSGLMFNHVRTHYSRADSEFQKFMKQDVDTAVGRLLKQQRKQEEEEAKGEE